MHDILSDTHSSAVLLLFMAVTVTRATASDILRQEAQLSQRDRATLRVIKYFAKSLKVIRNDTAE